MLVVYYRCLFFSPFFRETYLFVNRLFASSMTTCCKTHVCWWCECRRKIPTALQCSNDFINGTPMLSMSASSAYGSASDKSASCRRAGHLHPVSGFLRFVPELPDPPRKLLDSSRGHHHPGGGLGAAGSAALVTCPEYGYTHICGGPPAALLTRSCSHIHRRRSISSLDPLDAVDTDPGARPGAGAGPFERPAGSCERPVGPYERPAGVTVDRTGCGQPSAGLLPPPPPLTAYCHDLDLVSTANDAADDSSSFNWPSITA